MSIAGDRTRELAQWDSASNLLAKYGSGISDFLRGQMTSCLAENDRLGASIWMQVTEKIVQLRAPHGDLRVQ